MKTKIILSAIGILFVFPIMVGAQTAGYQFYNDLTIGSTGQDVLALQVYLNHSGSPIASTGPGSPGQESTYFGSLTQSALANFQSTHGISPAAGYFGSVTRAYFNTHPVGSGGGSGNFPAGCSSSSGFSIVTGLPCSGGSGGGSSAGCLPGYLFDTITGEPCDGNGSSSNNHNSGNGDGQLNHIRTASGEVENLQEGEDNQKVLVFKADVEDGDLTLERLEVEFTVNGSDVSNDISDYFDSVSVRVGSHEIDSMDADEGDRSGDTTSFVFNNLDEVLDEDSSPTISILVDVSNSIDNDNMDAEIEVSIPDDGIRVDAGDGVRDEYSFDHTNTVSFGAVDTTSPTASLTITLATSGSPLTNATVHVGDARTYTWSSTHADQWDSTASSTCTGVFHPWIAISESGQDVGTVGSIGSNTSCNVTLKYIATNSSTHQSATGTLTVTVLANPNTVTPTISSLNPTSGTAGQSVTITGTNFINGSTIHFGSSVSVVNDISGTLTTLNTSVPSDIGTGAKSVYVSTAAGNSNTLTYTINETVIPSPPCNAGMYCLSPSTGVVGSTVTLYGSGFGNTLVQGGYAGVLINQCGGSGGGCSIIRQITNPISWSDTRIVFRIPTGLSPGAYRIKMCNMVNGQATCSQGLNFTLASGQASADFFVALQNLIDTAGRIGQTANINNAIDQMLQIMRQTNY